MERIDGNRMINDSAAVDDSAKYGFWSAESLRKRPIDEQYPKPEGETEDRYKERLQEIQDFTELAQADLSEEDKREIEEGAYTEKNDQVATPDYRKFGISALRYFDMAEENPSLFHSDEGKFGLERQQAQEEKANYYIELYQKNQPELSEFSGLVSGKKIAHDQFSLQRKESKIEEQGALKSLEDYEIEQRMKKWDQAAEAVLYPLALNFGLLDYNISNPKEGSSGQIRARALYPSKYDDQFHGVDAAFMIPTSVNERGEIQYAPISLDCTTGTTLRRVKSKFKNINFDGRTHIDYAKTEDGDLMTGIRPLNFIIGIDHAALIGDQGLMKGDNIAHAPKALVHDIYVQIYNQARLRCNYYRVLRCKRGESKDARLADILTKDELADAYQAIAVRDFFGQKCEETAISKDYPLSLSRAHDSRSPVSLVAQRTAELLSAQQDYIEKIKKQKG